MPKANRKHLNRDGLLASKRNGTPSPHHPANAPDVSTMPIGMFHLTGLAIKNFRCFKDFSIHGLGRINLIAGRNNTGKTALLEALWIYSGPDIPDLGIRADAFRGLSQTDKTQPFKNIFTDFDTGSHIELTGTGRWSNRPRTLRISVSERSAVDISLPGGDTRDTSRQRSTTIQGPHQIVLTYLDDRGRKSESRGSHVKIELRPGLTGERVETKRDKALTRPISVYSAARVRVDPKEDAERLGKILVRGEEPGVIEILRILEPRLKRLVPIPLEDISVVHGDVGRQRLIPLPLMGDGLTRLLTLTLNFELCKGGLLLVDEIENGIHYTALIEVWKQLAALARKFDVQLFATTHSRECIEAAIEAFRDDAGKVDFSYHRLERVEEGIEAITMGWDELATASGSGLEIR